MKRCPQCLFLYPESDERCDFDNTPLEVVDEAEIDAATGSNTATPRKRNVLLLAGAVCLLVGVVVFAMYYVVSQHVRRISAARQQHSIPVSPSPEPAVTVAAPSPEVSPSPSSSPSPSPSPKSSPASVTSSHIRATSDPVSTSGPGIGQRQGGKPQIVLTSGGKIDADEVWRTRDGIWYRRNGMVTLLKRGQVKAIITR